MINKELHFIKLCKDSKEPIKKIKMTDKNNAFPLENINTKLYNVGLHAGNNNLIIIDVDKKDNGIIEFNKYIQLYNEPLTVKQASPNGGYHYIFNSISSEYTEEELYLISLLKNKAKYRNGKGIDIRINNGYIACEPSIINDKKYKFIRHYKDNKILNIPLTLLNWLLEFEKTNNDNNLNIIMNLVQLSAIIEKLSKPKYYDNEWFKITSCFKSLLNSYNEINEEELKAIWDNWSKPSNKYNKNNNYKIWDTITININFNYYINLFNKKLLLKNKNAKLYELYETIKNYDALTIKYKNIRKIELNNKFIYDENYKLQQVRPEYFKKYNTIIIQSGTGTGKTSNTAKHIKTLIDSSENENKYKIMSIISRKTLAEQHINSFNKEGITLKNYQDKTTNYDDDNTVICINSILKYQFYKPEFFKNYIIYIDEVNTFIRHFTHNDNLNDILKKVYIVLMKIINNCHKLICTESIISDNVFNLLSMRNDTEKIFFINNRKNYNGITATNEKDENNFFNNIEKHIQKDKYFLFGSDSCTIITKYYNLLIDKYNNKKDNFILVTSNDKFIINDASEQFKNKFVFYSPSITCGIDFTINEKQDVFLYMELKSIEPCDSFQQATRTRNINNLYYYVNENNNIKEAKFNNLNECSIFYKDVDNIHEKLNNICCCIDDNGDISFNENTFFKMYVYNEYLTDIYKTNKKQHFKNILLANGFNLKDKGENLKLEKETKKEMNEINKEVIETKFNEFVEGYSDDENLLFRKEYLKITKIDDMEKFKEFIKDKFSFSDYRNFIRLFYSDEKLNNILKEQNQNNVYYKNLFSTANKIKLIRELEKECKIGLLNINFKLSDEKLSISSLLLTNIQKAFRTKDEPTNYIELLPFYINRIDNIIGNIKLFDKTRIRENKKRITTYNFNTTTIKNIFELHSLKYSDHYGIHNKLLEKFKEFIIIKTPETYFIDDDDISDDTIHINSKNISNDEYDIRTYFWNGEKVSKKEFFKENSKALDNIII